MKSYPTAKTRQGLTAKIHIAQQQLGMDDDIYRAVLERITGQRSSKGLTLAALEAVLAEMCRLGFVPKKAQNQGQRPNPPKSRRALIGKLEAQLAEAGRHWSYADALAKKMFNIEKVDWLSAEQLYKLVAALGYDARRHGRPV